MSLIYASQHGRRSTATSANETVQGTGSDQNRTDSGGAVGTIDGVRKQYRLHCERRGE